MTSQFTVTKSMRASRLNQKPAIVWFTGLSGSGKSTTANVLEYKLFSMGYSTYLLDGDIVRNGLCSDLGFSDQDRHENIRRVGELAKTMIDAGYLVLVAFISPFQQERQMVRALVDGDEFIEVFVNTPIEVCEKRDPKGLYKKARAGEIPNFTGIDSPYEKPCNADIVINTDELSIEESVDILISQLTNYKIIDNNREAKPY